jgi:hypothetical protein
MQKQSAVLIICLGLVIVFPHLSLSFEYDVWKSGIAINKALKIAEMHDIPLTGAELNQPLQRGRDHYRAGIVKRAKKSRNLCYKQNLHGTTALITLHFTPMSKKLSNIYVNIMDADSAQQKEAILALSEKYGEPLKYSPEKDVLLITPGIRLEQANSDTQFFVPDKQNIIFVRYAGKRKNDLVINYNNLALSKQEQTEAKTFEQYFKTRYRQQDENRM